MASLRAALPADGPGPYPLLRYHMGWTDAQGHPATSDGGKALRPALCLLACDLAGGRWQDALPAAVALELVHNFSLVHDDIQDGDTERRHRPTVWSVWGKAKALMAGNAMRCLADRTLLSPAVTGNVPLPVALELSRALAQGYLEMIEGQYLDLSFEGRLDVSVDQYLDMVARKTGALIDCALFMGALVATKDIGLARPYGRCGRLLGLAFQIRDDLLGIWGDTSATGKPIGADIARRKKSLPAVYALERARGDQQHLVQRIYRKDSLAQEDVRQVLEVMDRLNAYNYCQALAEAKREEALAVLAGLPLEPQALQEFQDLVSFLVSRQH